METPEQSEVRRSKNYHTLSELEKDGNKLVSIKESKSFLEMRRGKTYTTYTMVSLDDRNFWYPVSANTVY